MTHWWVVIEIQGWVASKLTHLPEASSIVSYRSLKRYTDGTIKFVTNKNTGECRCDCIRVVTEETRSIKANGYTLPCVVRNIEQVGTISTGGNIESVPSTYWHIHAADGVIQIHKTNCSDSDQWTVEMWGDVPDADTLIRVIRKHISL